MFALEWRAEEAFKKSRHRLNRQQFVPAETVKLAWREQHPAVVQLWYRAEDAVVSAVGQLNRPNLPDIPGREDFAGPSFHSARWDYEYTGGDAEIVEVAVAEPSLATASKSVKGRKAA